MQEQNFQVLQFLNHQDFLDMLFLLQQKMLEVLMNLLLMLLIHNHLHLHHHLILQVHKHFHQALVQFLPRHQSMNRLFHMLLKKMCYL
jgi:hypothetical protein